MKPRTIWRWLATRPVPEGEDIQWNLYKVFPARSSILSNVSRRLERSIRLGLGGALIYVLSMINTSTLDYSFRYVGPFIYWVVATLTPPYLSTIPLLTFAGMFCIVIACCIVSILIACMTLGNTTGKVLTVVFYALFLAWGLGLNVGKQKELTIIGSYVLTYVTPLAALIALPYADGGLTIPVPPQVLEKLATALTSASPKGQQLVVKVVSDWFRLDAAYVERNLNRLLSDPLLVNMLIKELNEQLHLHLPFYPPMERLDPLQVLKQLMHVFLAALDPDKFISFPIRFNRLKHLGELSWIKPAYCIVEGSLRRGFTVHVETGLWLLRAMWTAQGRIGFLRNLLAFAALGFAIWVLIMLIPPVHRQRDVVRRNLANCTININRCLRATREVLNCLEGARRGSIRSMGSSRLSCHSPQRGESNRLYLSSPGGVAASSSALLGESLGVTAGGGVGGRHMPSDGANRDVSLAVPGKMPSGRMSRGRNEGAVKLPPLSSRGPGRGGTPAEPSPRTTGDRAGSSNSSYIRAYTCSSAKFQGALGPLKQSIIEITEDEKRVFLSGLEPYLFSAGPMVFVVKEVEEVRVRMLLCATYVQQLCRVLFDVVRTSIVNSEFDVWSDTVCMIETIIAKAEENYQTCGELIMMQPPLLFRNAHWKAVGEKMELLDRQKAELCDLHRQVSRLANEASDILFSDIGRSCFGVSSQEFSSTLATAAGTRSNADSEASAAMPVTLETLVDHESTPAVSPAEADNQGGNKEKAVHGRGHLQRDGEEERERGKKAKGQQQMKGDGGTVPLLIPAGVRGRARETGSSNDALAAPQATSAAADKAGRRQPVVSKKEERVALLRGENGGATAGGHEEQGYPCGTRRESAPYENQAPEPPEPKVSVWGLAPDASSKTPLERQNNHQLRRGTGGRLHRTHSGAGLLRDDAAAAAAAAASLRRALGRSWGNCSRSAAGGRQPHHAGETGRGRGSVSGTPSSLNQKEARNVCKTMDHMPVSMALVAKYHAAFKEPIALAKAVKTLQAAQHRSTLKGLFMNLVFPLLPMFVHGARLTITPLRQLLFWKLRWKGSDAWWRDPESWYIFKFFVPMLTLFSFAVFFKEFSQYTWGQKLTDKPIIIDFCTQGITTRMVPWIMLGFLTCFQTTYNGTVFRGVNRIVGIVCGSFAAWLVMKTCDNNIAKIVCFSCCLLGMDIFLTADTQNPNYGFHHTWGYAGMVFTYTQALIVGLAYEDLGGLTGARDYLTVTRIVSSILGVVLAIVVAHLPPACSGNNAAARRYGEALESCSQAVEKAVQYILESTERGPCEGHAAHKHLSDHTTNTRSSTDSRQGAQAATAAAEAPAVGEESDEKGADAAAETGMAPLQWVNASNEERLTLNTKGAREGVNEETLTKKGRSRSEMCTIGVSQKQESAQAYLDQAKAAIQDVAADKLQAGQRLYKEGCSAVLFFPWRTSSVLEDIYITLGTMRKRVEDMCDMLHEFMTDSCYADDYAFGFTGTQTNGTHGSREAAAVTEPLSDSAANPVRQNLETIGADSTAKRKGSLFVLREGNAMAVMELFGTRSGARFRSEMTAAVRAVTELSAAVATEMKLLLPTTVDRLMSFFLITWPRSKVYSALPDAVHEQCRSNVETAFSQLMITLSSCLTDHRTVFEQSVARRRAAAFTIMVLIYYLDMHKRALDCIHESLVACRESPTYWGWLGNCLKPNIKGLGVD